MTSNVHPPKTSHGLIAVVALLAIVSIALPVGIVYLAVANFFAGRTLGVPANVNKVYQGVLENSELWFSDHHFLRDASRPQFECRIMRLNLETGVEQDSGIKLTNESVFLCRINGDQPRQKILRLTAFRLLADYQAVEMSTSTSVVIDRWNGFTTFMSSRHQIREVCG